MLTASGFNWWFEFIKFIFAVFLAFFIPGSLILPCKITKSPLIRITLSILIGIVLWGWQEYVFGYLSFRDLSYFYLIFCFLLWIFSKKSKSSIKIKKIDPVLAFLLSIGIFMQILPLWHNGIYYQNKGLLFTGGNESDNLWHVSLANEIIRHFPPSAPGIPTIPMQNYHYWSNLVIASLVRIFKLPLFSAQFQFFPLLICSLLGFSTISFCKILNLNKLTTRLLIFFNYFGGDLIYLILLILRREPNPFIMSSLEDGVKFFYNPPRAFAFIITMGGLCLFALWRKKKKISIGFLSMFLLASTTGFKIYLGIFLGIGVFILTLVSFLKKNWREFILFTSFFVLAGLIYFPTNANAGGLIWAPFSIVNNFIIQPALKLEKWEMARIIFHQDKKHLQNFIFEISFTALFLIGIWGTKIIGFFQSPFYILKKLGRDLSILLISGIFLSTTAGIFFIQKTGGANTFNFLVSVFLFSSIFAALSIDYWQQKLPKICFSIFITIIILLTIPRVSFETTMNIKRFLKPEGFLISNEEIKLYQTVNEDSSRFFRVAIDSNHYLANKTPYVSIFLDHPLLVSGNEILKQILPIDKKEKSQSLIFTSPNEKIVIKELLANQIKYIILYDNHALAATESAYFTSPIIKNKSGILLEVDRNKLFEKFWEIRKQLDDSRVGQ